MAISDWFDTSYYAATKTDLLNAQQADGKTDWTVSDVTSAIEGTISIDYSNYDINSIVNKITASFYSHYKDYGSSEGLNPNMYFDQSYYLQEKADLLNTQNYEGRSDWTSTEVEKTLSDAGLTPYEHYSLYGASEGLDPSALFSTSTYLANKAVALNSAAVDGKTDWTASDVLDSLKSAGLDPVSHFMQYGGAEGLSPNSGDNFSLKAVYNGYSVDLEGVVGSTVSATLTDSNKISISSATDADYVGCDATTTIGSASVSGIDASDLFGAGVSLTGNNAIYNSLIGTASNDTLCGGLGSDFLTGNGGADTFVYHFGDATTNSDSTTTLRTGDYSITFSNMDTIDDFAFGTDKLSCLTSSGSAANPSTVYYGGTISIAMTDSTGSITYADGTTKTYSFSSTDDITNFQQAMYSAGVSDKNGALAGSDALGANEAMVWNVNYSYQSATFGTNTSQSYSMVAVNDSDATFNNQDLVIQLDTTFTGSYDTTTGVVSTSLFS